jgi:hypothetical protein
VIFDSLFSVVVFFERTGEFTDACILGSTSVRHFFCRVSDGTQNTFVP